MQIAEDGAKRLEEDIIRAKELQEVKNIKKDEKNEGAHYAAARRAQADTNLTNAEKGR